MCKKCLKLCSTDTGLYNNFASLFFFKWKELCGTNITSKMILLCIFVNVFIAENRMHFIDKLFFKIHFNTDFTTQKLNLSCQIQTNFNCKFIKKGLDMARYFSMTKWPFAMTNTILQWPRQHLHAFLQKNV